MSSDALQKLIVLKASAGSGKTYHLALEYISLAITGKVDFRQILAVTFTNKATREMKERILNFLQQISKGRNGVLIEQLSTKTQLSASDIQTRSSLLLQKILHNYSHFGVSTIDSFNQKILRGFTREIGLIGNFNLELDYQKVLDYSIDKVIESANANPEIIKWLLDFSREKLIAGSNWDIRTDLANLASELNSERFKILEADDPNIISDNKQLDEYIRRLKKIKFAFENHMKNIGLDAVKIAEVYDLIPQDFSYGESGVFGHFIKIQSNNKSYEPGQRALKALEDPESWYSKKSDKKESILAAVENGLHNKLEQAIQFYESKGREYISADSILKNMYALGLFTQIKKAIDDYKFEKDLFLLSDTNIFLKGIIQDNETPFIYEKTGSWYSHFLIDEFQDTSRLQWENLKPLIANSLAELDENLIVGDAKQSIYRWRGGDWELIEKDIHQSFADEFLQVINLDTNWRSAKHVVEFNNSLFRVMPSVFKSAYQAAVENEYHFNDDFDLIYQNIEQKISAANQSKEGHLKINFSEKEETKDLWKEKGLEWLKKSIEELQDANYSLNQIAILTRTKSEGTEAVNFLNEQNRSNGNFRYDVISGESLLIKNFPSIRLMINCLKLITDPESKLFAADVAIEYSRVKNESEDLSSIVGNPAFVKKVFQLFPPTFLEKLENLKRFGLLESFSFIVNIFGLDKMEENLPYLMAFQDIIHQFVNENGNDIGSFIEWWENEKDRQTLQSPENINAIRVMTIHKSKGLEFDAVLIPFFNWEIDHSGNKNVFIWCKNHEDQFDQQKIVPLKYQSALSQSYFEKEYCDEKHRAFIDNLNLCYVAFTRAKKALMIHGESMKKNKKELKNVSEILIRTLEFEDFELKEYFDSETDKFTYGKLGDQSKKAIAEKGKHSHFIQNDWSGKIKLRRRGRDLFEKSQAGRKEKINHGLLVHEVLAEIHSKSEINKLLSEYQNLGLITRNEISDLLDQFDRVFANPVVNKWFESDWEVKRESTILSQDNVELRPDRVLVKDKKAIIIDFKTGREMKEHSLQLMRYRNKLIEMDYQAVDAFVLYINTNKVKQIA